MRGGILIAHRAIRPSTDNLAVSDHEGTDGDVTPGRSRHGEAEGFGHVQVTRNS